jgi:hypothetical protein
VSVFLSQRPFCYEALLAATPFSQVCVSEDIMEIRPGLPGIKSDVHPLLFGNTTDLRLRCIYYSNAI